MRTNLRTLFVSLLLSACLFLANCGGGGGGGGTTPPPPPSYQITTPSPLPEGAVSLSYNVDIVGNNPQSMGVWEIVSGTLPPGMSFYTTIDGGSLGGVPATEGTYNFKVKVTWTNVSATKDFTLTIKPGMVLTPSVLPDASTGVKYEQTLSATKVGESATWAVYNGHLPDGLSLTGSGATAVLSGIPPRTGTFDFTLCITDGNDRWFKNLSINVGKGPLSIATTSLPDAEINRTYVQNLKAFNSASPIWSISSGSLPPGITLYSSGWLSGSPTQEGTFQFTAKVVDGTESATQELTLKVVMNPLVISTSSLADGNTAAYYSQYIYASGGALTNRQWSIVSGSLPPGLTATSSYTDFRISGKPETSGTYNFTLKVVDGTETATKDLSIKILAASLSLGPESLPDGITGKAYSSTLFVNGGSGTKTFAVTSGALPDGLVLDTSARTISGTPQKAGNYAFTITVSDDAGSVSQSYVVHIIDQLVIVSDSLPPMRVNELYSFQFQVSGGLAPYGFSGGPLPRGVTLSQDGKLEGTPGLPYSGDFWLYVSDSASPSQQVSKLLRLVVEGPMEILTTALPPAIVNQSYDVAPFAAAGGTKPYTWSVASGSLPAGLSLDPATGKISGTPTGPTAETTFTIQVTDSSAPQKTATRTFSVPVRLTPGRNDTVATATYLYTYGYKLINGSISPYADPEDTASPDTDYYRLTADGGNNVQISIQPFWNASAGQPSKLVPVVEVVDENGNRLQTCLSTDGITHDSPCLIDSQGQYSGYSSLYLLVPGNAKTVFYLHVLDFFGDARPDYMYQMTIYGAD